MARQSFLGDEPWDAVREELQLRTRAFARGVDDQLSASVIELLPGSPGDRLHMHYGIEEMFFVLSGTPILRNGHTEEQLAPGDVVHCPEGRAGLHTFTNPAGEPARILAVSSRRFPDVLVYPEQGVAWVATRNPDFPAPAVGDPGVIARFELPAGEPTATGT
jgi:uncharacterized cupin superfamily protein